MTSIVAKAFAAAKQDFKQFWDTVVLPEVRVVEAALENVQKELEPIEQAALKAIGGAAICAMSTVSGGVVPSTVEDGLELIKAGAKAALSEAEKQGVKLTSTGATALAASLAVPTPVVQNGANG